MKKKIKSLMSSVAPGLTTRLIYFYNFRKRLDLENPKTFNEKIQFLKLKTYYNNPVITQCVDKWRLRDYVAEHKFDLKLPGIYYGGITDPEEVRQIWEELPDRFVIKCNHGAGYNIVVHDKQQMDVDAVVCTLARWMKEDYWKLYCEPQYMHVKKCILIEEYLGSDTGALPVDYKCYCFNGRCEMIMACTDRGQGTTKFFFFDREWMPLPLTRESVDEPGIRIEKPAVLEQVISGAEEISKEFPFVRVDLYVTESGVYLGELTFVPSGGLDQDFNFVSPDPKYGGKSTDVILGEMLDLH